MMKSLSTLPFLAISVFLLTPTWVHAGPTAAGVWEFDRSRKDLYVESVRAQQQNSSMSEIAVQMGISRMENQLYEFGFDKSGPFLRINDKATNKSTTKYIRVEKSGDSDVLIVHDLQSRVQNRLEFVDDNHITFYEGKSVVPLRRLIPIGES